MAIGSLPHKDTLSALELIKKCYSEIPFWAQLSQVNPLQDMTVQYSQKFPGLKLDIKNQSFKFDTESDEFAEELEKLYNDYYEIIEENNSDLLEDYAITEPFTTTIQPILEYIKEAKPDFVKGQIIGPFTWGTMLTDADDKCLFYDETSRDIVVKTLTLKALWQIKKFKEANPSITPIIFIDEPTMSQVGTSAFLTVKKEEILSAFDEIITAIQKREALVAIHCCGKADWELILKSKPNIINFDAYSFHKNITTFSKVLKPFLEKGGYIAWGIVPTLDKDSLEKSTVSSLMTILENSIDALAKKGISKEIILKQAIITPSCGAGGLDIKNAEKAMEFAKAISDELRKKYEVA